MQFILKIQSNSKSILFNLKSPLHTAVINNDIKIIQALLENNRINTKIKDEIHS